MKVVRSQWCVASRSDFCFALWLLLFALCSTVGAQSQGKSPARVGWLWYGAATAGPLPSIETAIIEGLRGLGYVDGKTILFEHRFADGHPEKLPELAAALARQKVDVIIGLGGDIAAAAKKATQTIPIVVGTSDDPVRASLISSLARPGGNVTGVTFVMDELAGKRIQLLKEINPKLSSSGVLWNPAHADNELREIQIAAEKFNVKLKLFKVERMGEFDSAISAMKNEKFDALVVVPSRLTSLRRSPLAGFALKSRIPMASGWREFAEGGGLLSYGPDRAHIARRIAHYVDRVLKGAKPADLPVETPSKFELVINLKTAQEIGLTIPQSVLYRADKVIR
ncbi:MAG TPA: ABC transporter substrate-binding protein [Candidatus Udaeobacter sp.]|nr:ABC transporter substrate-binding protein [Candidatus Udaeobacter sp.]